VALVPITRQDEHPQHVGDRALVASFAVLGLVHRVENSLPLTAATLHRNPHSARSLSTLRRGGATRV
jgi:hypothetical protein